MNSTPSVSPHDRPTPAELLEAVREYLTGPVEDGARDRLHRRVAANVVAIVERELAGAAHDGDAHARRLGRLGVADDRELAALAARTTPDDPWFAELAEALAELARDKVAVVNPRYLADQATGDQETADREKGEDR